MSTTPFVPGWHPDYYARARARVMARTGYVTFRASLDYPEAWCIPAFREMEQGQAGTCWVHAATAATEDFALAHNFAAFPICRRMVGYAGCQLEGGGNPTNGGSPTDAMLGMSDIQGKGYGCAHESLLPYSDSSRDLGQTPPANVIADAKNYRLTQPVDIKSDDDSRRAIFNNHACFNGIWWPFGWDDNQTFFDTIGRGTYGHALEERGYAMPGVFDNQAWFNLRNWHGKLYPPLKPEFAAKVPNYRPDTPTATSDFWVNADTYATVRSYGNAERGTFTDLTGFGYLFDWEDMAP